MTILNRSTGFRSSLRILACILAVSGWIFSDAAWGAIVNEPMTGSTAPGWVIGGSAYLSASTGVDPVGDGWLRITDLGYDEAGFAFLDQPFDISQGVIIQFDYATYGGAGTGSTCGVTGADGYSIYLFDGSYGPGTFNVGASGGSLGYDKKTSAPVHAGLTGGYVGVGIDEWGNFAAGTEGRLPTGTGMVCNGVTVRGPWDHPSGSYYLLNGAAAGQALAFPGLGRRTYQDTAEYRKVVIKLTPVSAPNYLQVDTYIQFGINQPLTKIGPTVNTMRPVPASVKVGYAASTGGSNNYHEIRNLVIDPLASDINLSIVKLASSPSVTQGGPLTYTITARNGGPNNITANNMQITDTMPAQLTGVTWTCGATGVGASCGVASGSGNINTTVTLPVFTSATFTVTSTVTGTAPLGSAITNIASLTTPTGIADYNPSDNSDSAVVTVNGTSNISIAGLVYNDANHNGVQDGGETGTVGGGTMYAKLFRSSNMATALTYTTVASNGTFTFTNVPTYDTYTIMLDTNNTPADSVPGFTVNWIYTAPDNYTSSNIAVTNANVTGQKFGVYNGSRIMGKVINDNGLNGAPANANDGVLNAGETGIPGVSVWLADNTGAALAGGSGTTGAGGSFTLYTTTGTATLRIYETDPAGYVSVNGKGGSGYNIANDYISFAYTQYTSYGSMIFGDVQNNIFLPTPQAQTNNANTSIYFAHTFTPGTGGLVTFSTSSHSQGSWPALVYYQDTNCNGSYDGGDTVLSGTLAASAGTPICILVKNTIPAGALLGTTDQIVSVATFSFSGSVVASNATYTVTDTTTVAPPGPTVTVSGLAYSDANFNGNKEGGETSPNIAGIYAKLFSASDLTTALSVTTVVQSSGTYTFTLVSTNAAYVIILSSTNNTSYDPSFPNTQWVATSPANYALSNVIVGGANLTNQNFGVFNGTRIDGMVLQDDGAATGSNANNGVQNPGEPGIAGQTMSVCDNSSCTSISTAVTDTNGAYSLFVPWATNFATARVTQTTMSAGDIMVTYNPGTALGSAANLGSRYVTFTFTRGTSVTGLIHSDAQDNTFTPTPLARNGAQTAQIYYAHTFTPGTGGTVSFATSLRSQPTWPVVTYYQDNNCSGTYDAGDALLVGSLAATKGAPICILVKDTILATAPTGTTDQIVTQATFTFTNSYGPKVSAYTVTDTTTVVTPNLATSTKTWTDLNTGGMAMVNPSDTLQYTITIINSSATVTAYGVSAIDNMPASTNNFTVISIPAGATDSSTTTGGTNNTGYLNITNITVPASGSVTIVFNVTISSSFGAGTINNTATLTLPVGPGPMLTAPVVNVTVPTGNKPLYLYSTAGPSYLLSRMTPTTSSPILVSTGTGTIVWQLGPALQSGVTLNTSGNIPVKLNLSSSTTGTATFRITLACAAGGSTSSQYTNYALTTTVTSYALTLPAASLSCPAGSYYTFSVYVTSARSVSVSPIIAGTPPAYSQVVLPSLNVISVNSLNAYLATYPSTSTPASGSYAAGQMVYLRSAVSDPFGSFDITSALITISNPTGTVMVSAATVTNIVSSTTGTNTYEYTFFVPPAGPAGIWTASLTAKEGTENTVSDTGINTFRVAVQPNIMVLKSAQVLSDPMNGASPNAKAIPGAVMEYTVTVTNAGSGVADADSIIITDPVPDNTTMYVDAAGAVTFTCGVCGLTDPWTYANAVSYSYQAGGGPPYVYPPSTIGYDPLVRGVQIKPSGVLNGGGASFTVKFRVKVN